MHRTLNLHKRGPYRLTEGELRVLDTTDKIIYEAVLFYECELLFAGFGAGVGTLSRAGIRIGKGPLGKLFQRIGQAFSKTGVKSKAFKLAKTGRKHSGIYKTYLKRSTKEIKKAVKGYQKQVKKHINKIKNPKKYIKNWDKLSKKHQRNIIKNWGDDIERNKKLQNVMEGILKKRGIKK